MQRWRTRHDIRGICSDFIDPASILGLSGIGDLFGDSASSGMGAAVNLGGGGTSFNPSSLIPGLGELFQGTPPSTSDAGGPAGIAPYTTAGGPFGIGSHTIPGLTAAPPTPTYAPTLQFGPIPAMAQTAPNPLTPLTPMTALPGPSSSGMLMGGVSMSSPINSPIPQVITPGMSAGGGPMPQQTPYMPQMSQQQMPFMAPDGSVQAPQQPQPAAAPYPASPMAQPQQMAPWQQAVMSQLQQSGISPASMSQALMPTALAYTGQPQGQAAAPASGLVPPPPPYIPTVGSNGQPQSPQGQQQGQQTPPQGGGIVNVISAISGYPKMLLDSLQQAQGSVDAFNGALKAGSTELEGAITTARQALLGPAQDEVREALTTPVATVTGENGQKKELTAPQYKRYLTNGIQALNEDIAKLNEQYQKVGAAPETGSEIAADEAQKSTWHEEAQSFASGFPKKQQGGLMKMLESGFGKQNISESKGAIADDIAKLENQRAGLQAQAAGLDARIDVARNRFQKATELANKAAESMRSGYYDSAKAMVDGVKGMNQLQAETARGFISDQQHQGMIEQMQNQNALTAAKIWHEADMKGMELQEKAQEAGQKGYQATQQQRTTLVAELMKKLPPGKSPDYYAKAFNQLMDATNVDVKREAKVSAFFIEHALPDLRKDLKRGLPNG